MGQRRESSTLTLLSNLSYRKLAQAACPVRDADTSDKDRRVRKEALALLTTTMPAWEYPSAPWRAVHTLPPGRGCSSTPLEAICTCCSRSRWTAAWGPTRAQKPLFAAESLPPLLSLASASLPHLPQIPHPKHNPLPRADGPAQFLLHRTSARS